MQRKSGLHKQAMNAHLLSECMCRHCKIATVDLLLRFLQLLSWSLSIAVSLLCLPIVCRLFLVCVYNFQTVDFEQNHNKENIQPSNHAIAQKSSIWSFEMLWRCVVAAFCFVFRAHRENFCVDPLNYNRTGIYSDSYNFSYGQQPLYPMTHLIRVSMALMH